MCHNNPKSTNLKQTTWWQRTIALLTCVSLGLGFVFPSEMLTSIISAAEEEILVCEIEEHIHSPDCYELICMDDSEEHEHSDECYELVCGMEEHEHSDECYEIISPDVTLNSLQFQPN